MVIELCGLPGAGKTTLADAVVGTLRAQGIDASVGDRAVSAAAPRRGDSCGRPWPRAGPCSPIPSPRRASPGCSAEASTAVVTRWRSRSSGGSPGRSSWRAGGAPGVVVLEEGVVQALWSAGLRSSRTSAAELVATADGSAVPDLVVLLDVPTQLATDRIGARDSRHSRVQRVSDSEQPGLMQAGAVLLDELIDQWRGRGLSDILVLDGTGPDCAAELARPRGPDRRRSS